MANSTDMQKLGKRVFTVDFSKTLTIGDIYGLYFRSPPEITVKLKRVLGGISQKKNQMHGKINNSAKFIFRFMAVAPK